MTPSITWGKIRFVEIVSQAGGQCRLRNPWGEGNEVMLWRNGARTERLKGSLLKFDTAKGDDLVLVPNGVDPKGLRRSVRR